MTFKDMMLSLEKQMAKMEMTMVKLVHHIERPGEAREKIHDEH